MLSGNKQSFDDESKALYDVVAPPMSESDFTSFVSEIDAALKGEGSLQSRYSAFKEKFKIPKDKIYQAVTAANWYTICLGMLTTKH